MIVRGYGDGVNGLHFCVYLREPRSRPGTCFLVTAEDGDNNGIRALAMACGTENNWRSSFSFMFLVREKG